ncbi:MAG: GGDEF domain-containing protein [Cyanobacteria bacterium P01_F01_bin.3]
MTSLHVAPDIAIAIVCCVIPVIVFISRKQMNTEMRWFAVLFSLFVLSCGLGHLVSVWNIWHANYWIEGSIKCITAVVGIYTAMEISHRLPLLVTMSERLDVSEQQRYRDELAGLFNRRAFIERLTQLSGITAAHAAPSLQDSDKDSVVSGSHALLLADLDGFKGVNDRYGHPFGDRVLSDVAALLIQHLRKDKTHITRLGGDEFALLVPFCVQGKALQLADHLRSIVLDYAQGQVETLNLGVSVGVYIFSPSAAADRVDRIYEEADQVLYHAKQAGKRCVAYKDPIEGVKSRPLQAI